ncbi:unnamed protein product, partial [marine sediment metagenome]
AGKIPPQRGFNDKGTAARFFPQFSWQERDFWPFRYQAKPSRAERERGLGVISLKPKRGHIPQSEGRQMHGETDRFPVRNSHPTVKPIALMKWLITLVLPPGGVVLDPFAGSGTTLCAAKELGFKSIGIELQNTDDEPYCEIAKRRIMATQAVML